MPLWQLTVPRPARFGWQMYAGISQPAVFTAVKPDGSLATVSLDEPVLPDGSPLEGLVADPRAAEPELKLLEHEQTKLLADALADLPERQRRIVSCKWGIGEAPMPNAVLASKLALSPRRTQTIGRDALYGLRKALDPVRSGR